jgi:predicted TIM-barrel fold metal-dependent hydrolase
MHDDTLVIDAVAHGFNWRADNRVETLPAEAYHAFIHGIYQFAHVPLESLKPGYQLTFEEYTHGWQAEDLAQLYFEESDVDVIAYHHVVIGGCFKEGSSPWHVGLELKRAYPDRVLLYAFVDPLMGPVELDMMEEKAQTGLVDGFKFYPANGVFDAASGTPKVMLYDDPELAFPYFEKARSLGVSHIAIHKAAPVGPGSLDKDRPEDVSTAALAFPDMTFEVVHSGYAFLEECVLQLSLHPNIYANLETTANFAVRRPRKFAQILGEMLMVGGEDRILWGTGAPTSHPQPVLEAFAELEMPADLVEGYGYPELTDEVKRKILGLNMARLHDLDVDALRGRLAADEWSARRAAAVAGGGVGPWKAHRERIARESLVHA